VTDTADWRQVSILTACIFTSMAAASAVIYIRDIDRGFVIDCKFIRTANNSGPYLAAQGKTMALFKVSAYFNSRSLVSSVNIVTSLRVGRSRFESWQGQKSSLFVTASVPVRGPPGLLTNGYRGLPSRG
jgi:hypothetical protein